MEKHSKKELILNIYGQEAWHTDAKIVGSKAALEALKKAIDIAIKSGFATISPPPDNDLFASDGEGYLLGIYCLGGWDDKRWSAHTPNYEIVSKHFISKPRRV